LSITRTATELRRIVERSALRDPECTPEDRHEAFALALRSVPDEVLDWLHARISNELHQRGRGPLT
jgi:hypothetical protein